MPTADAQDEDGPENAGESAEQNSGARTLPTTPKKASNVQEASNSAPARTKAAPKKNEATLLNDFLRGKPSTNRPRRRNSAIKRTAVKASAVRQLRPPGRVNERVRQWQKASAGATPPDVHGVEVEQPSEEKDGLSEGQSPNLKEAVEATDPLPQLASAQAAKTTKLASSPANGITDEKAAPVLGSDPTHDRKETGQKTKPKARKRKSDGLEATMPPRARGAPIKRVVSDSHWVNKTAVKKPAVKSQDPLLRMFAGPMAAKRAPSRKKPVVTSLPKDFTETNNANPPTERKIQDWIQRSMQLPSSTPNKKASPVDKGASKSPSRKPAAKSLPEDHLESNKANPTPEKKIQDWVERNARRSSSSLSDESKSPNQPPMPLAKKRIKTSQRHHLGGESSGAGTDDIVVEVFSATGDDATSIKETKAAGRMPFREADFASRRAMFTEMRPEKRKEDRRSAQDGVTSDGSKTYAAANRFATLPRRKAEAASLSSSVDRERQSREREISALNGLAFVSTKNTKAADESPDLGRRSRPVSQTLKSGNQQYRRRQARATRAKSLAETSLSSLTSESDNSLSDTTYKPRRNQSQRVSRDERRKSFDEIPVGHSAFSVLEFPTKEGQRRSSARREKPQRKSSLAGVPSVLKRVYNEGMKIVQDTVDPPRVVISQPPNIVSWLNQTSDPFYESNTEDREKNTPKPRQASSRKVSSSGKLHGSSSGSSGSRDFPLQSGGSTEDDTNPGDSASKHDRKKHDGDHDHDREHNRQRTTSPQSSRDDGLRTDRSSSKAYAAGLNRRPAQRDIGRSSPVERKYPRRPALSEDSAGTHTHSHNRQAHTHDRQAQPAHSPSTQQRSERPDLNSYMTGLPSTSSHKHNNLHDISYVARKRPSASPPRAPKASRRTNHAESATTGLSRSRHVSRRPQAPAFAPAPAPGLKRRLTKHSDLMSALSLPDTAKVPDRSDTIISARSLRTRRAPLETDDVQLIFAEVSADELKYKREIETLVDGVIPVLLTSALSRLDAEDADSQSPQGKLDEEKTRSIIEMGTALERIKRLHHSIPLFDAVKLACWISSFVSAYDAYLDAWRYGYEEIVVNLAPARGSTESGPTRTANGEDGTNVVDVAYLLRRPLVRVKYLARAAKVGCRRPTRFWSPPNANGIRVCCMLVHLQRLNQPVKVLSSSCRKFDVELKKSMPGERTSSLIILIQQKLVNCVI